MKQETLTITKKKNGKTEMFDSDLFKSLEAGWKDIKAGRVRRVK